MAIRIPLIFYKNFKFGKKRVGKVVYKQGKLKFKYTAF